MRSAWMCLCPSARKSTSTAPTKGGVARIEIFPAAKTVPRARVCELRYGRSHLILPLPQKRVFCHPILQLVRLQSETSVLCVCCVSVDGCMVDGARFMLLLAGLEAEGDGSSPSAMPRSAAEAIVQPSCVCLAS